MAKVTLDPTTGKVDHVELDEVLTADHPDAVSNVLSDEVSKLDALGALSEPTPEEVFAGAAKKEAPKK